MGKAHVATMTRTSVTSGSNTNHFLRDGAYVTDPVLVDSGATYTPGISEQRGTTTTYLHSGLKNAFAQSGTSQNVTATREYDAFGNVTSPSGSWAGPFGYAGKFGYQSPSIPGVTTPDGGITLMGHRYYDSSTGRFLTRDPIFDGRNWYSYGGGQGNPLTQADPTGLITVKVGLEAGAALIVGLDGEVAMNFDLTTGNVGVSFTPSASLGVSAAFGGGISTGISSGDVPGRGEFEIKSKTAVKLALQAGLGFEGGFSGTQDLNGKLGGEWEVDVKAGAKAEASAKLTQSADYSYGLFNVYEFFHAIGERVTRLFN